MGFTDLIREAQLHREVYIAIMRSVLPYGEIQKLFPRVGVTREHLENILNVSGISKVSRKTAENIAHQLPLSEEKQKNLIEHMLLSKEKYLLGNQVILKEFSKEWLEEQATAIRIAFAHATKSGTIEGVGVKYRFVRDTLDLLLKTIAPKSIDTLTFVDLCMLQHNVKCVLDELGDALFYAKLARLILQDIDIMDYGKKKEGYHFYRIEAARAEALAYNNMALYSLSYKTNQKETLEAIYDAKRAGIVFPLCTLNVCVNLVRAYSRTDRFALYEVELLSKQALQACNIYAKQDAHDASYWEFVIYRSLGAAYLYHDNVKKSKKIFVPLMEKLRTMSNISIMHQVSFLQLYARMCLQENNQEEFNFYIKEALNKAKKANLKHQITEMQRSFGKKLQPIQQELDSQV